MSRRNSRGVLLVEAVLASVVIAVGLTFITRGLGSQVHAVGVMEEYDTLARLADDVMADLERSARAGQPPTTAAEGAFEAPWSAYGWTITAEALPETDPDLRLARVSVRVRRAGEASRADTVTALWPLDLVPAEWL